MQTFAMTVPAAMIDAATERVLAFADGATAVPATGHWRPAAGAAVESEPVALLIVSAETAEAYRAALAVTRVLAEAGERAAYVLAPGPGAVVLGLDGLALATDTPPEAARVLADALAFPEARPGHADDVGMAWADVVGPDATARAVAAVARLDDALAGLAVAEADMSESAAMREEAEEFLAIADSLVVDAAEYWEGATDADRTAVSLAEHSAALAEAYAEVTGYLEDAAERAEDSVDTGHAAAEAHAAAVPVVRAAVADLIDAVGRPAAVNVMAERGRRLGDFA